MKITIRLFTLFFLLFSTTKSFTQIKVAPIAGLNLPIFIYNPSLPSVFSQEINPSFNIGGLVDFGVKNNFSIQSGLLLTGKGSTTVYSFNFEGIIIKSTASVSLLYLEIPLNALYKLKLRSVKLQFFGGPYLGLGIGGKTKIITNDNRANIPVVNEEHDIKLGFKTGDYNALDIGINIGVGIEINKNFLIRTQYGLGLSDFNNLQSTSKIYNSVFSISGAYMFSLKKK